MTEAKRKELATASGSAIRPSRVEQLLSANDELTRGADSNQPIETMKEPKNENSAADGSVDLFSPFEHWGSDMWGLCAQDGKITKEPSYEKRHTEWRIVKYGEGLWEIEVADEPEGYEVVYRGKIPSNRFLRDLLANLETPPPLARENIQGEAQPPAK